MQFSDTTPAEGPTPIQRLTKEVEAMRLSTDRLTTATLQVLAEFPKLERRVTKVRLFQAWFPTVAIASAIIVRLVWLR